MIVGYNDKWVICTPTKCGTFSLEGTLIDRMNVGYKIIPRHRVDVPPEIKDPHKMMVVRDPLERFVSMFWFLTSFNEDVWLCYFKDIETWVTKYFEMCDTKPHWMWTNTMRDNYEAFKPHEVFKIEEDLQVLVDHVCHMNGYTPIKVSRRNATRSKQDPRITLEPLKGDLRARLRKHLEVDYDFFAYSRPAWL